MKPPANLFGVIDWLYANKFSITVRDPEGLRLYSCENAKTATLRGGKKA